MKWEQHGRNYYRREGDTEYMISKSANWGKWHKHANDSRWAEIGTYATLEAAME